MARDTEIDQVETQRRRRRATMVILAILLVGSLPIVLPLSCMMWGATRSRAMREMLIQEIDHAQVLAAARTVLQENYRVGRWIHPWELPETLRDLQPAGAHIDGKGLLRVQFSGGLDHLGLIAAAEGQQLTDQDIPRTQRVQPLIDGLWLYEEQP